MYTISTVTQPSADTRHPLLLLQSHSGERYLFGKIGEGAQRALTQNKIRVGKLENIFLTGQMDWAGTGGLAGLILTIADQGRDKLALNYGNDLINYVVSTWRYFVFRFGISLTANVIPSGQSYSDKLINVKSFVVAPETHEPQDNNAPTFTPQEHGVLKNIITNMFPKIKPTERYDPSSDPHLNVELPRINFEQSSTSYEIEFNPIRGKFKFEEAVKLGVPRGPMFRQLTEGQSVTLQDGSIVTPEQVLEGERSFQKVLIVDIPDNSYLPAFKDTFKDYDATNVGTVYYFLSAEVAVNDELIAFMEMFNRGNGKIQHIVSHPHVSRNSLAFVGSAVTTLKLKALQPEWYNLPRTADLLSKEFYECFKKTTPKGTSLLQTQDKPLTSSINNDSVHVLGKNTLVTIDARTKEEAEKLGGGSKVEEQQGNSDWKSLYCGHVEPLKLPGVSYNSLVLDQLNANNFNESRERARHVEIITFGTGSALPSKYRNVVSTLVKVPYFDINSGKITNRNILLDAGENTVGQISRHFSEAKRREMFQDLRMIYLSHLHADHHLGIVSMLKEWYKYNKNSPEAKIYLITPWQYNKFIREWMLMESPEILLRINYISNEHFINKPYLRKETKAIDIENYERIIAEDAAKNSDSEGDSDNGSDSSSIRRFKKRRLSTDRDSSFRNLKMIRSMFRDLRIEDFQTCKAIHCNWAYSNSITFKLDDAKTFKVSYSGDTRPNVDEFSHDIGVNSDLLIHEATLDNELQEDAISKRHCTINEAIKVSNEMYAQKLILTHFSQRYPKAPSIDNNIKIYAKEYCFAFDGMIVDFERMGEQKAILPMLSNLFVEEAEDEDVGDEDVELPEDNKGTKKQKNKQAKKDGRQKGKDNEPKVKKKGKSAKAQNAQGAMKQPNSPKKSDGKNFQN